MQKFDAVVAIFDDVPDSSGVIVRPGAVTFPRVLPITDGLKGAVIGTATLSLTNEGRLCAAMEILNSKKVVGLYPAVAGLSHRATVCADGNVSLDDVDITDLTLTKTANSDSRIQAL